MPELPEVETIRRQLVPHLEGRRCLEAESHWHEKFLPAREVVGCEFLRLERKGKYLICELGEEGSSGRDSRGSGTHSPRELIIHLGMTGKLVVVNETEGRNLTAKGEGRSAGKREGARGDVGKKELAGKDELVGKERSVGKAGSLSQNISASDSLSHVRARWQLDNGTQLVFNDIRRFGRIRVVPKGDYSTAPTLANQGPDALSPDFTAETLHQRIRQSSRALKTQLLSQRPVAGLGNIYADEALWQAGIHPARRNLSFTRAEILHQAIGDVLERALKAGGTTLRDYRTPDESQGSFQKQLNCYGLAGDPCGRCENTLSKSLIDARTTTWCSRCQK